MDEYVEFEKETVKKQMEICTKYGAAFMETPFNKVMGIALNTFGTGVMPIHGLRIPDQSEQTVNWYIWAGEYSDADDFYQSVHVHHLLDICPQALVFLGLQPGWRFLFDNAGYEDVWFDEKLLK